MTAQTSVKLCTYTAKPINDSLDWTNMDENETAPKWYPGFVFQKIKLPIVNIGFGLQMFWTSEANKFNTVLALEWVHLDSLKLDSCGYLFRTGNKKGW